MPIQREKVSLEQLFEREPLILMDTGVRIQKGDRYAEFIYPYDNFLELDPDILLEFLERFNSTEKIIRHAQVFTVDSVIDELERFEKLFRDKLGYMNRVYQDLKHDFKRTHKRMEQDESDLAENNRRLFQEATFALDRIVRFARGKKTIRKSDDEFVDIAQRTYKIAERPGVKISYAERYNNPIPKKSEDLHADEELAATSLYLAMKGQSNAIFTGDSDIARIVNYTLLDISKGVKWMRVREQIKNSPVRIYFTTLDNVINLVFDTANPETYF